MIDLDYLKSTPLYKQLVGITDDKEGNLLENIDGSEQAQVNFIAALVSSIKPTVVIEVGTNKALFGYLLSELLDEPCTLYTMDIHQWSSNCVSALNRGQKVVDAHFILGDSRYTYPASTGFLSRKMKSGRALAYIDGGHDTPFVTSDLINTFSLGIRHVLVDDYLGSPHVPLAVNELGAKYGYRMRTNPFAGDTRGLILLTKQTNEESTEE